MVCGYIELGNAFRLNEVDSDTPSGKQKLFDAISVETESLFIKRINRDTAGKKIQPQTMQNCISSPRFVGDRWCLRFSRGQRDAEDAALHHSMYPLSASVALEHWGTPDWVAS